MSSNLAAAAIPWMRTFWPEPLVVGGVQRLRMAAGALIGITLTAWLSHHLGAPAGLNWIVAPMGASAVLVFCLPASPLAQPWPVVGGNTVSALIGMACAQLIPAPDVAAGVAVALAIGAMLLLRCLHPPGGATALLMVLSGVHDPSAALVPVGLNALLLTLAGLAYNNATRHSYPHRAPPVAAAGVTEEDLDAVLNRYNELLDVSRDDLRALIDRTQRIAQQRRLADTRCGDVMTRDIDTVEYGTSLHEAWALMRRKHLKTLPVLDRGRHVVGIVTLSDFLNAAGVDAPSTLELRLRALMRPSPASHSSKPEVVGQIMTRKVRVTREHRSLSDLVLLFDSAGHRHIPVVGESGKLLGMVTQSDVMAALKVGASLEAPAGPAQA
jgi:CBS domain-containing membrane protein